MSGDSAEIAAGKTAGRPPIQDRRAKSRVSNGTQVLPGVDGRSLVARRYRDITSAVIADQGGLARMSEARQQLIRRFAAAAVIAEQIEAKLANGEAVNIQEHALLSSTLTRLASRIGIDRRMRTITPSLQEYLVMKDQEDEVEIVEAAE
jgi:hypothetical protein